MKMKEIIGSAREERQTHLMQSFQQWIRGQYGRDVKPGDKFKVHFPGGGTQVWKIQKDGYFIDHGQPMLSTSDAHYNLGKSLLKKYKAELL